MNAQKPIALVLIVFSALAVLNLMRLPAADPGTRQGFQYATIRWAGRDGTHVIRPSGRVEFAGPQLASVKKPDRTDERAFYMNVVMNALGKEGYEFAGMTSDEIVMKRPLAR